MKYKFNILYFTDYLNATTSASVGVNDLSPEMKTYYDDYLIDLAQPELVHDQFGQKRPIPQGKGKIIEFRQFTALPKVTTPLTEGVTPDGQPLDVTAKTAEVRQYGGFVRVTDVLELTAIDNVVVEALQMIGRQAGKSLDTITREVLAGGSNVQYGDGTNSSLVRSGLSASTASHLMSVKAIKRAVRALKRQDCPMINGNYIGIIHPDVAYDLMNDSEFVEWQKYTSPEHMYNNEIGKVAGVRFVETTEAKIFTADDLASDSRNLAVNGNVLADATTAVLDGGTFAENALVGRKLLINGKTYTVASNTASSGTATVTLKSGEKFDAISNDTVVYPGEAGAAGADVYATLIIGANAYGVTEVSGGGLQTIIKQKGSAGTADPLDQRSTVGWKAIKTAERLIEQYMIRIETPVTA